MTRHYDWEFPLNVPGFTGHRKQLVDLIVKNGLWDVLPIPLVIRLDEATKNNHGITITKADLDSIDDVTWDKVLKVIKQVRGY